MKKFNLEEAKAGKPVINNHGLPARIVCFDRRDNTRPGYPILALVDSNGGEICRSYSLEGIGSNGDELMMKPEKITLWANVYSVCGGYYVGQTQLYSSKEESLKNINTTKGYTYIDTVKIEVEV